MASPRINVRLPAQLMTALELHCQTDGRSTSEVAVAALTRHLSDSREIKNAVSDSPLTTNEQRMVAAVQAGIPLSVVVWEPEREPEREPEPEPEPLTEKQQEDLALVEQLFAEQGIG